VDNPRPETTAPSSPFDSKVLSGLKLCHFDQKPGLSGLGFAMEAGLHKNKNKKWQTPCVANPEALFSRFPFPEYPQRKELFPTYGYHP